MHASQMSSRERIRAVIAREPVDHLPLCFEGVGHAWPGFLVTRHPDPLERAERMLALGLDVGVVVQPPRFSLPDFEVNERSRPYPDMEVDSAVPAPADAPPDPGYTVRHWTERPAAEEHTLLCAEYATPAGKLRQVVRQHEYPYRRVSLTNDLNIPASRSREYLVKGRADLDALEHVLKPPTSAQLAPYRQRMKQSRAFCDAKGVLLSGRSQGIGDTMFWLSGAEAVLMMAMDDPASLERYAGIVSRWNDARLEIQADAGVDLIIRRGWYEGCDFWSPELYRRFLMPVFKREIERLHQAGILVTYSMGSGSVPLLDAFLELRFDVLSSIDPLVPGTDVAKIKEKIGDVIALYGGVNNFHVIEQGEPQAVRTAVFDAVEVMGKGGGYILGPGDTLDCVLAFGPKTERNFHAMIEAWKECR
jgi:hypothetical protein